MNWVLVVILVSISYARTSNSELKLHIVTVATNEENNGLNRLRHSAELYGHELLVLGLHEEWKGGDMQNSQGGAQKIRILREGLTDFQDKNNAILMFIDAYDVIINAEPDVILRRFAQEFPDTRVLFSAEPFCWPDKHLASNYPIITFGERYLNSGMFMGYAMDVLKLLNHGKELKDDDDDQRFYTSIYLNKELRDFYKISLDSLSRIFQNLNGLTEDVHIDYDLDGNAQVFNSLYNTHPVVIHGNGPSKIYLNQLGNYIAHGYNEKIGCLKCKPLVDINPEEIDVNIAIFIAKPIPFVDEFLAALEELDYPKGRINLLIYNNQPLNKLSIKNLIGEKIGNYKSITALNMKEDVDEHAARDYVIEWTVESNADFLLMLDADAHFTNSKSLRLLIQKSITYKIGIVAPMIAQPKKLFTNFWGAVSSTGYYARSTDYLDIVENKLRGYWNVPFIGSAILIAKNMLPYLYNAYSYNKEIDSDMSFCMYCRNNGHFMYVDNLDDYGFLAPSDHFSQFVKENYKNPEMYDYFENHDLWEKRYIHHKYFHFIKADTVVEQPCPDVYDFPFLSERFAKELIEVMENFGHWSDGSHLDRRLDGGYENVPTRDIHMNQVNFDKQFINIIDEYVAPMQEKVFTGYYQRPAKSNMMFVVRYKPEEQAALKPHHDASTYSIDIALNKKDVDYEGGGVRYIRYNCTIPADQIGWSMLFPGRLTHLHEGLPTTKGTRYILVSFINP